MSKDRGMYRVASGLAAFAPAAAKGGVPVGGGGGGSGGGGPGRQIHEAA